MSKSTNPPDGDHRTCYGCCCSRRTRANELVGVFQIWNYLVAAITEQVNLGVHDKVLPGRGVGLVSVMSN